MAHVTLRSTPQFTNYSEHNGHQSQHAVMQHNSARKVVCGIVHLIPGRVRFRVPRLICDAELAQCLPTLLLNHSQVIRVRVKRAAASIVIYYQTPTRSAATRFCSRWSRNALKTQISEFIRIIQTANEPVSESLPRLAQSTTRKEPLPQAPIRLELPSAPSITRACSLDIRQAVVPAEKCGLFRSKTGHTLRGNALAARIRKLYQHRILYLPTGIE
jgi:hypothetical protein